MSKEYHLKLKGYVGGWNFDRNYTEYVLDKNAGKHVDVLIDSLGGSLSHGLSISALFKQHGDVTVHYIGMNASAATIASLGAKHVSIDAGAMYLVHQASLEFFDWSSKNATDFEELISKCQKHKDDLDKIDLNVAALYAARCKRKPEELYELMKKGGWLTPQEAKEWGFVDEITDYPNEAAAELTEALAVEMAAHDLPIPDMPMAGKAKESMMAKLLGAIESLTSMFKNQFKNIKTTMKKSYTLLCALLGVTAIEMAGNKATMTEEQLDTLEGALADRDKTIEDLTAKVTAHEADLTAKDATIAELQAKLDAKPAADTEQVIENGKEVKEAEEPADPYMQFCETFAAASKAYNALP